MSSPRVGVLCSLVRPEEKLLFQAFREQGVLFDRIDERTLLLNAYGNTRRQYDVVLERSVSHSRGYYAVRYLQGIGTRVVNTFQTIECCGDKALTTMALSEAGVPIPRSTVAFTPESALQAIEEIGYPVVMKPVVGSWGRLLSKINDRDAAEAVLEHKKVLGNYQHSIFYIQEFVQTNCSDIRAFVIGNECIAAIRRTSQHWVTNTARGGVASNFPVSAELNDICIRAARAVQGDVVAIDLFETQDGYLVNEVNSTMEFRNSIHTTGVNIPGRMVDYVRSILNEEDQTLQHAVGV
ncbi:MAG: lysine biosynthesis protein LysX [Bdellovibrionales bacterium]|nr:lysine biosynthesis protein LysX [Bdellovibrionales bacterium]